MNDLQDAYTLPNGHPIPCIGFGTWKAEDGEVAEQSVANAIAAGYRHIDTAAAYDNETSVGKAIRMSDIDRESLFVTSKMWNSERGYDKAIAACEQSLTKLQLDYLDLYLVHWPAARGDKDEWSSLNADTWRAFEKLYADGKVKAIGVSNFKVHHLDALLETAEIIPMVNQIEFHPGFNQIETRDYCRTHAILVEAWSPLGAGKVLSDERLQKVADTYGCSVAQLCVRWCLQHQTLPLPKSTHLERIKQNAEVFGFEISSEDMQHIDNLPEFGASGLDPDTVTF